MAFVKTTFGHTPETEKSAFVAETAVLTGNVRLEEGSSVWYGAVLRADDGSIVIGKNANVQDNCVLHSNGGFNIVVGENTSIGHSAVVHGCTVGKNCLIGMHSTILNGAVIGDGSLVAAGALVTAGTIVPPNSLVMGVPAKVRGSVSPEQTKTILKNTEEYLMLSDKHTENITK